MLGQTGVTVSSQADLLGPGSLLSLFIFLRRFVAVSEASVQEAEIRRAEKIKPQLSASNWFKNISVVESLILLRPEEQRENPTSGGFSTHRLSFLLR